MNVFCGAGAWQVRNMSIKTYGVLAEEDASKHEDAV